MANTNNILRIRKDKNSPWIEVAAIQGEKGADGVGITSIETTSVSGDEAVNTVKINLDNETSKSFEVKNGSKGSKGDKGVSITNIATETSAVSGGANTVTITLDDPSLNKSFTVLNGKDGKDGVAGAQGEQGPIGPQGKPFAIKKTYVSVELMEQDIQNPELENGDIVAIANDDFENPDNAKLYVKESDSFKFLVDMSGAQGIQGPKGDKGTDGANGVDGAKGDKGDSGVYVGSTEPIDTDDTIWINPEGSASASIATQQYVDDAIATAIGGIENGTY